MKRSDFQALAKNKIQEYFHSFVLDGKSMKDENYRVKVITPEVCVVSGSFILDTWIYFTFVCKLEDKDIVICHTHFSADSSDDFVYHYMELKKKSRLDSMTQVYNRSFMEQLMDQQLKETGKVHAFIMVDLDNFKFINDTWGHVAGDKYLIEFANLLKDYFGKQAHVARMGGDEFCIFMNVESKDKVEVEWEGFLRLFRERIQREYDLELGCTAGICFSGENGWNFTEMYKKADQALYRAKKERKGGFHVYGG